MPRAPGTRFQQTILVVEDDIAARDFAKRILDAAGFDAYCAASGREAARLARLRQCDVILALDKPVSAEALLTTARRSLAPHRSMRGTLPPDRAESYGISRLMHTGSAAARWARHVADACGSAQDFKTLASWARFIGVSPSSLSESCRMLGIRPRDARDFARVLRALIQANLHQCSPLVLLDVSDRRTLRNLIDRMGVRNIGNFPRSIERFFEMQQLIPRDHEEVKLVRSFVLEGVGSPVAGLTPLVDGAGA